jgi:hypothetical protein
MTSALTLAALCMSNSTSYPGYSLGHMYCCCNSCRDEFSSSTDNLYQKHTVTACVLQLVASITDKRQQTPLPCRNMSYGFQLEFWR